MIYFLRYRRNKVTSESRRAVEDANRSLERVKSRSSEVREVSGALRSIRERNHFAEQLRVIMEGGWNA